MISIKNFLAEHFEGQKVLRLTLHPRAFEVMITGEKQFEYRKPSTWLKARLYDKQGKPIKYNYVLFVNGYGDDLPFFITKFGGAGNAPIEVLDLKFSTGFKFDLHQGDVMIFLPKVVAFGNVTGANSEGLLHYLSDEWNIIDTGAKQS